jgi:hypothetical protein
MQKPNTAQITNKIRKRLLAIREELVLLDYVNKEMTNQVNKQLNELDTQPFSNDFGRTPNQSR